MNKIVTFLIITCVLAVSGVFYLFLIDIDSPKERLEYVHATSTFDKIVVEGGFRECNFSVAKDEDLPASSGTMYIAGDVARIDSILSAPGEDKLPEAHTIVRDGYMYVWSDSSAKGFKISYKFGEPFAAPGFSHKTNIAYECDSWNEEKSLFKLPKTVDFLERTPPKPLVRTIPNSG